MKHKSDTHFKWVKIKTIEEMQLFYLSRLDAIREISREHGYAIGLHGSTRRDFDLIAVPWVDNYADRDTLASAIQYVASGGLVNTHFHWECKPNGRVATSFPICWTDFYDMISPGHIDLSIMAPVIDLKDTSTFNYNKC